MVIIWKQESSNDAGLRVGTKQVPLVPIKFLGLLFDDFLDLSSTKRTSKSNLCKIILWARGIMWKKGHNFDFKVCWRREDGLGATLVLLVTQKTPVGQFWEDFGLAVDFTLWPDVSQGGAVWPFLTCGSWGRSCILCHLWLKIRLPVLWDEVQNWIDHEKFYRLTSFLWNHTPKLNSKGSRRRFQALGVVVVFLKTWTGHSGQIWAYWSQSEKSDKYHLKSSGFIPFWN